MESECLFNTSKGLATQTIMQGFLPELNKDSLSVHVVSMDNIDIIQPRAFVSSTFARDGTSVHSVVLQIGKSINPSGSTKHSVTSPSASPILVEKCKKRKRTLPSPHSAVTIP